VRRSVSQRNGVVPGGNAFSASETESTSPAESVVVASDTVRELHQRTSSAEENDPQASNASPGIMASVIERITGAGPDEHSFPNGKVANCYHQPEGAEVQVQTQQCSDYASVIEAYRMVDDSETSANGHSSPQPMEQVLDYAPSSQANGFENLLKRVGKPEGGCQTAVFSAGAFAGDNGHAMANGHGEENGYVEPNGQSQALILRPTVQSVPKRPPSPEYLLAPGGFRGYALALSCSIVSSGVSSTLSYFSCVGTEKTADFRFGSGDIEVGS
jgi:hypothetical protein